MSDVEEQVPGVTFFLRDAALVENASQPGRRAVIRLDADIHDEAIYTEVMKKFQDGFRVFTMEDFKGEILLVVRTELQEVQKELKTAKQERDKLQRENVLLEEENAKHRAVFSGFSDALLGLG